MYLNIIRMAYLMGSLVRKGAYDVCASLNPNNNLVKFIKKTDQTIHSQYIRTINNVSKNKSNIHNMYHCSNIIMNFSIINSQIFLGSFPNSNIREASGDEIRKL